MTNIDELDKILKEAKTLTVQLDLLINKLMAHNDFLKNIENRSSRLKAYKMYRNIHYVQNRLIINVLEPVGIAREIDLGNYNYFGVNVSPKDNRIYETVLSISGGRDIEEKIINNKELDEIFHLAHNLTLQLEKLIDKLSHYEEFLKNKNNDSYRIMVYELYRDINISLEGGIVILVLSEAEITAKIVNDINSLGVDLKAEDFKLPSDWGKWVEKMDVDPEDVRSCDVCGESPCACSDKDN